MNKEPQKIYIVWDYWIDYEENKVYAVYVKDGKMYLMEQELKNA